MSPNFLLERGFYENGQDGYVLGVDEVGRGAMAGSVVAAACCFDVSVEASEVEGVDDSKNLSKVKREKVFEKLRLMRESGRCYYGIGEASVKEIDQMNILQASLRAMSRAVDDLRTKIGQARILGILVDGNKSPRFGESCPVVCVPKGDSKSYSIAGASIVAKVNRDEMMMRLGEKFVAYGWEKNAGYGTKRHLEAMRSEGITPHHRLSFSWENAFGRK